MYTYTNLLVVYHPSGSEGRYECKEEFFQTIYNSSLVLPYMYRNLVVVQNVPW